MTVMEGWARQAKASIARGDTNATAIPQANRSVHLHPGRGRASESAIRRSR